MAPQDRDERPEASRASAVPRDVRRALEQMRQGMDERVTAAELAAACGVPERTLRRHFRHFVGLPPLAHLRRLRLAAARADLLACEGRGSVTEIAGRLGFLHLGRFASDYARRFGEPPSATLRRSRSAAAAQPGTDPDRPRGPPSATESQGGGTGRARPAPLTGAAARKAFDARPEPAVACTRSIAMASASRPGP